MRYDRLLPIIAKEGLKGTEIETFSYIGGGSFGRVYRGVDKNTGKAYVFKLFLVPDMAEKEANAVKKLGETRAVKFPEIYFIRKRTPDIPVDCVCMEFVEGKNAFTNARMLLASKKEKRRFANEVVTALLKIHSVTSDKFGYIDNSNFDTWLDFYRPYAADIYEKAQNAEKEGKFDAYILKTMTAAYKKFDVIFSEDVTEASLIHGDLNVMNVMVDRKCRVTAFIDPLNSMYADREYELFQLRNLTGDRFKLYDTYKSRYKVSARCDEKCAFYALWNEAMVYLKTGRYTRFIMRAVVKRMKKELKKISAE